MNKHKHKQTANTLGRSTKTKQVVQGILQRTSEERGLSRAEVHVVPGAKKETLQGAIKRKVKLDSTVYTDSLPSYTGLSDEYKHEFVDHKLKYVAELVHTNGLGVNVLVSSGDAGSRPDATGIVRLVRRRWSIPHPIRQSSVWVAHR